MKSPHPSTPWNLLLSLSLPACLILTALISLVLPQKSFSPDENRYLQKRPAFTWKTMLNGSFASTYDTYLSDQFPLREHWIAVKTDSDRLSGSRDTGGVYFGKDDYLIEKFDTEDIEGPQLDYNLDALADAVKRMEQKLGADHVRVMLVPGASQIMTDKLPALAAPYDQSRVTQMLAERLEGEQLIVPVEAALRKQQKAPLYYRTDHHWTTAGACIGYEAWAGSVGITPWEPDRFEQRTVSNDFLGTLYSKVQTGGRADSIICYFPKEPAEYQVEYDENGIKTEGLYTYEALKTRDQYAFFLDGNHGLARVTGGTESGEAERAGRRLMVIKDSYAHSIAPFLVNHFEETLFVDLRYFNADPEQFAEENGVTDLLILYRIPGFAVEKTVSKLRR